jgi:exodeoxyribonuclease V beta subunit
MLFDVLSRHLNVFEPHFLEASAGTGKTFAIEHLVTRLLIESDPPFLIEQILVVTFTRAATRELKSRIRRTLVQAKENLFLKNPILDYLQAVIEQGEEAVQLAIEKLDAALICFDSAQIFTLHGFCHRLLKEFAFEAEVGMQISDPDEADHLPLLQRVIKTHLQEQLCPSAYSPEQIQALLKRAKKDPRRMISSLAALVGSGKEIADIPSHAELLEQFLQEIKKLPLVDQDLFKEDLSLLTPQYKLMAGKEIPSQITAFTEVLSSKECSQKQFDRFARDDFFLKKMSPDNQKVRAKFPEPSQLHYPLLVEHLRKNLLPLLEEAANPSRIFLRVAKDLQKKSQLLLEEQGRFSPDALLLKVEEALQKPKFVKSVQQKFRAAIIDEFQDTDPIQWKIFKQLFLSKIDSVCLVGDPKQSIYSFRNADLHVYMEAAKAMGPYARKHLGTNFRSTAPLVEGLNLLFSKAKKGWMDLPGQEEPLDVMPVKAGAKIAAEGVEPPVQFFVATDKKGRSKKFPTAAVMQNKVFPFLVSEILKLHREKGIQYHDVAILVKDRFQSKDVIDYLKECGIPASSKRGGSILETPAYFVLKEILEAACAPYDMSRIKAALGGPLIAWREEQLFSQESTLLEAKAKMLLLNRTLLTQGFGCFFESLLSTKWGSAPLLQELFLRGEVPLYLDLRKLAEILIEEETTRGLKGEEFLLLLEELSLHADKEESRLKVPSAEEKGSVTVMTIHMSKGLEFEAVFALGLASRHKPSDEVTVKVEGRNILTALPSDDPAFLHALEEQDAEKMRQLYVALTRAKRHLYIPLIIEEEQKEVILGAASPSELFFSKLEPRENTLGEAAAVLDTLAPLIGYQILAETPRILVEKQAPHLQEMVPPNPLPWPIEEKPILSFSSLAKKEGAAEAIILPESSLLSPHTFPLGAETGHLLHGLFEKIFKRGLHHPLDENKLLHLICEEVLFSPLEQWREAILPWVIDLLKRPLGSFSLTDVPTQQLQPEMEFLFPTEAGLMKGFVDLWFEYEGKYYLLDWKSNYLGPTDADYTQERIIEAMKQHQYDLQASIYASALKRYVKLFDNRPFSECFGGAIYYFVRGKGVYHFLPQDYP